MFATLRLSSSLRLILRYILYVLAGRHFSMLRPADLGVAGFPLYLKYAELPTGLAQYATIAGFRIPYEEAQSSGDQLIHLLV